MLRYLLAFLLLAMPVWAANTSECNASLQPGMKRACPPGAVGQASLYTNFTGVTVEPRTNARAAIDAFGYCRFVDNSGDKPLFIPFANEEEWRAYLSNHPPEAVITQCARGGLFPLPPNFGKDPATNQCASSPATQTVLVPYRRATEPGTFTTPRVTYDCTSAEGTDFELTAQATLTSGDSGYGPSSQSGWSVSRMLQSYDGLCGSAKDTPTETKPTEHLCAVGEPGEMIGLGPWTWVCKSGNGGGKNMTCSSPLPCPERKVDEKPCRCEDGNCYRPIYMSNGCGKTWIDKSQRCEKEEPLYNPPAIKTDDYYNKDK